MVKIKEKLAQYDILRVDDLLLRNDLIAIRENKDFIYFNILDLINADRLTFAPNWEEFYAERWDNILNDEILSGVNPYELIIRKMEIGSLLIGKSVPNHLKTHLSRIKECYAWGFETESAIYCRTILEEDFKEALKPKPEFRTPREKEYLENLSLCELLIHSRKNKYFYKEVIERAFDVKNNVNKIVHPTSAKDPKIALTNIEIIKDTFYILEMLFR